MKKSKLNWRLDPAEVSYSGMGSCKGGRKKTSQSRALDTRSMKLTVVHIPTNLEVNGEIPNGNYSRKEMRNLEAKLRNELFVELERKVAKKLRISGYS